MSLEVFVLCLVVGCGFTVLGLICASLYGEVDDLKARLDHLESEDDEPEPWEGVP
jgi:hypothetical protein